MPHHPWPALAGRPTTVETEDGVRLHAEVHGPDDPSGTVVLLHGYQLSQRLWARQVDALRTRRPDVRVVCYDHRGHGRSTRGTAERATLGQLGRDLRTVLDAVTDGPVVLAGHSMGGMTVMAFAEQFPHLVRDRVAGVGLFATSSGGLADNTFGLHPAAARVAHVAVPRLNGWVRRRVERGGTKPPTPGTRWLLFGTQPNRLDVLRTQAVLDATHPATADDFYGTFSEHARTHALAALADVPVVVAAGDRDRLTPLAHSHVIAGALPHAELVVYPGSGHMVQLERAHDVSRRLVDLVATALPRAAQPVG
jgi:pimeloyl-ACP methyl ester carboxylesterase